MELQEYKRDVGSQAERPPLQLGLPPASCQVDAGHQPFMMVMRPEARWEQEGPTLSRAQ